MSQIKQSKIYSFFIRHLLSQIGHRYPSKYLFYSTDYFAFLPQLNARPVAAGSYVLIDHDKRLLADQWLRQVKKKIIVADPGTIAQTKVAFALCIYSRSISFSDVHEWVSNQTIRRMAVLFPREQMERFINLLHEHHIAPSLCGTLRDLYVTEGDIRQNIKRKLGQTLTEEDFEFISSIGCVIFEIKDRCREPTK